jgi:glutamate synthase (NADPH/NADH) small chain
MVPDEKGGRPRPVLIEGSEEMIECDTLISAIGQQADYSFLPEDIAPKVVFNRGMVQINEFRQTADEKIFAGGDIANRKRDAISAIADGHAAAKGIDIFLTNFKDNK